MRGAGLWKAYRASAAFLHELELPNGTDPQDFTIESATWQGVNTELRRTRGSAQIQRRGLDQIARGADQILIYLQIAGEVACSFSARQVLLRPGDVAVFDYTQPSESQADAFENHILMLTRDSAPPGLLSKAAHGFHLPADAGLARLIAAGMATLEAEAEGLSLGEFEAVALALADIVAEPVRAWSEREAVTRRTSVLPSELLAQGMTFIDERIANRALNPEQVGAHLELSRSALYRLFAPYGGVRAVILARRLDCAVTVLLSDQATHHDLAGLAKRYGFPDGAYFSRLFAQRFGMPPSRYCKLIREGDPAWLAAQNERAGFTQALMVSRWQPEAGMGKA